MPSIFDEIDAIPVGGATPTARKTVSIFDEIDAAARPGYPKALLNAARRGVAQTGAAAATALTQPTALPALVGEALATAEDMRARLQGRPEAEREAEDQARRAHYAQRAAEAAQTWSGAEELPDGKAWAGIRRPAGQTPLSRDQVAGYHASQIAAMQQHAASLPGTETLDKFRAANGIIEALVRGVPAAPELIAENLPQLALIAATRMPAALAGGGRLVQAGLAGTVSTGANYQGEFLGALQEITGKDLTDPAQLQAALADQQAVGKAARQAALYSGLVGTTDTISGGMAGRLTAAAEGQGAKAMAKAIGRELTEQTALDAAGETSGQLAAKGQISAPDLAAEIIVGRAMDVPEIATGMAAERRTRAAAAEKKSQGKPPPAQDSAQAEALAAAAAEAARNAAETAAATKPPPAGLASIEDMLNAAAKQRLDAMQAKLEEEQARTARQQAAREKREKFDFHLNNARQVVLSTQNPNPGNLPGDAGQVEQFSQVQGALAVLRDYLADNSLGLTLDQRQQAQALATELQPIHDRLKARADAAAEQRQAEAQAAAQAADAERKAKLKAEMAALQQQEATGRNPQTGLIVDLTKVPEAELEALDLDQEKNRFLDSGDELTPEAIRAELERRAMASERAAVAADATSDRDLLAVLEEVKLPTTDAALGGELAQLREEMNAGQRMRLFSTKGRDLDAVAEVLRADHGFDDIQTPADVIAYAQRALRGEQIRPTWRGERVDFARGVEPGPLPPEPKLGDRPSRSELGRHMRDFATWMQAVKAWVQRAPDVLPFRRKAGGIALVSRNTTDAQPWRVTIFNERHEPTGHISYPTKEAAVHEALLEGTYAPDVQFARSEGETDLAGQWRSVYARMAPGAARDYWGRYGNEHGLLEAAATVPLSDLTAPILDRFEARLQKIAPGLMARYRVLVGDLDMLRRLGVPEADITGREQAAHFARRRLFWFLQQNLRAGKDGLMPDRLRRDVLHEATHAWLDTLDADTRAELEGIWQRDLADPQGWLATARQKDVELRRGVATDFNEYWAERLAEQNSAWAGRRESLVATDRTLVAQIAHELRAWLQETLDLLRAAFSRTRRYNLDFRRFLDQATGDRRQAAGQLQPMQAATQQAVFDLGGTALGLDLPNEIRNLSPRWQDKVLRFESSLDKALYYAQGDGNTAVRDRVIASISEQTGLTPGQVSAYARRLRERLARHTFNPAPGGELRVPDLMGAEIARETGVRFARAEEIPPEQAPAEHKLALLRELADFNRRLDALTQAEGHSRPAARELMGLRNDVRQRLDAEFPGWRQERPDLADGKPGIVEEARSRGDEQSDSDLEKKLAWAEQQYRANGSTFWREERDALRDELAARRRAAAGNQPPTEPPTPTAEAAPADEGPRPEDTERGETPLPADEMPVRPGIFDEIEGHGIAPTTWLEKRWESVKQFLQGFRGSMPELPAFADDQAQTFSRLRQGGRLLRRATYRVWKEAGDQLAEIAKPVLDVGDLDANAYKRLGTLQKKRLRLRADERPVPPQLDQEIAALRARTDRSAYGLFQNLALYLDLKWRSENLQDDRGNPISLPGGINRREIAFRLAELQQALAASPHRDTVLRALQQHQALVKAIADDLKARDLRMPDELRNPFYFPHVLAEARDTLERVRLDTAEDFRGYLQTPVGSTKPIETDYVKAMYYHLVAVGSHNLRADIVRDYWQPYDKMTEVRERAKELAKKYGRPVSWREAYATDYAKRGYVLFHPDDKIPLHPEMAIDRDTLARRLGVVLTEAPLQQQLEALGLRGIKLLPSDIKEALGAGEREVWVVPEKVAEALNGMMRRAEKQSDSLLSRPFAAFQRLWKKNILFAPWNYPRYEFNNTVTDLEKLFSADPLVFTKLSEAAKEVRAFIEEGKGGQDVREAFKRGVLDSVTVHELDDIGALREFEALQTGRQKVTREAVRRLSSLLIQPWAGSRSTLDVSRLREATFRFAKFKADVERMRNGARPVYAGAYWRDIEAIGDTHQGAGDALYNKAAEISLATFGDYHNLSVSGEELRRLLVPFYSWMEINFKYHANLFRNLKDMAAAGETSGADAAKAGARAGAVMAANFTRKAAASYLLRLALPYALVTLWNNWGDNRELEDELSDEDKRRFHIVLGRDANGKTRVLYAQTALGDIVKWISGQEAGRQAMDYLQGRTDLGTAVAEWAGRFPRDFANNLWQVGPIVKGGATALSKKSTFPDVTDQRTIPAYDLKWVVLGQMVDQTAADVIRRAVDKDYLAPKDFADWAQQAILQVRKRDPRQWAFYEVKDKAAQFLESRTGQKRDSTYDAPDQQVLRNFRRSIYRGDVANAMRFYDRLLELGYTAERFKASIRAQDPLSELPKELRPKFVEQLSPFEREQLRRAYEYYQGMAEERGAERVLFPSERATPAVRQRFIEAPRHERLQREMANTERLDDTELARRADAELRRSLRVNR